MLHYDFSVGMVRDAGAKTERPPRGRQCTRSASLQRLGPALRKYADRNEPTSGSPSLGERLTAYSLPGCQRGVRPHRLARRDWATARLPVYGAQLVRHLASGSPSFGRQLTAYNLPGCQQGITPRRLTRRDWRLDFRCTAFNLYGIWAGKWGV